MSIGLSDYEFQLGDTGVRLNSGSTVPFVDISKVSGLDNAPYRETIRDHEGADGGFIDAEFEKGRDIILEGMVYGDLTNVESILDSLKLNFAPVTSPIPFYIKPGTVNERLVFVKSRGARYDWDTARRIGCTEIQFLLFAEDPRIYDANLSSVIIGFGGIAGNGLAFTTYLDTFTRVTSSGFGTSNSGNTYTLTGTAADFSTDGTKAKITLNASTTTVYTAQPNVTAVVNQYAYIQGAFLSATPTGGSISALFDLRAVDASNYYRAELIWTTSNTIQIALSKTVASVNSSLVAATTVGGLTSASLINVRVEVTQGQSVSTTSAFRAKVWAQGTAEPTAFNVEAFDGAVTAAGGFKINAVRNAGNTNSAPIISFDQTELDEGIGFNLDFGGGAAPSGTNVTNIGNRATPINFILQGPIDNPVIFNNTSSHNLQFAISLSASDTLTINTRDRTVYLNGNINRRSTLVNPDWFFLDPGTSNITFGGSSGTPGTTQLTMQFRSAWR